MFYSVKVDGELQGLPKKLKRWPLNGLLVLPKAQNVLVSDTPHWPGHILIIYCREFHLYNATLINTFGSNYGFSLTMACFPKKRNYNSPTHLTIRMSSKKVFKKMPLFIESHFTSMSSIGLYSNLSKATLWNYCFV